MVLPIGAYYRLESQATGETLDRRQEGLFILATLRTTGAAFWERLRRNATPLRMAEKRPQRDVEGSRALLLKADRTYQMNQREWFFYPERHVKIDNTTLEPDVVARRIAEHFSLLTKSAG